MANIYDVAGALQQPNIVNAVQQGVQMARQNAMGNIALQQAQQQQQDMQTLRGLAPQVVAGDQSAFEQAAALNPDQANALQAVNDAKYRRMNGAINFVESQTTPQAKQAAWAQARPYFAKLGGIDISQVPEDVNAAQPGFQAVKAHLAAIAPQGGANGGFINVGAGGAVFDPVTKQLVYKNEAKPELVTDANGRQYWAVPGQNAQPIQIGNGAPSSASGVGGLPRETQNYVPAVLGRLGGQAPLNADGTASQALIQALVSQESGGNPNATSSRGAQGLTQVMPTTGANPGFGVTPLQNASPQENLRFGQDYLNAMLKRYGGNVPQALAAYNAGPGTVDNAQGAVPNQLTGIPKREIFTQLTPEEVQANGLPAGTIAQRGSNGKIDIVYKPNANEVPVPIPGDQTKTGDDYLATLKPALANTVKAIAEGRVAYPTGTAAKGPQGQELVAAVNQYDPSLNAQDYQTRLATRKSFTSGTDAKNMMALNQVAAHLEGLVDDIDKTSGTELPLIPGLSHAYNQFVNSQTDPNTGGTTSWNLNADAVAHELRSLFAGSSGGTLAELEGYLKNLDAANTTVQKQTAIHKIADLAASRIDLLKQKYQQGLGRAEDPFQTTFPHAANVLMALSGRTKVAPENSQQPQSAPQTSSPSGQQDFSHLWGG